MSRIGGQNLVPLVRLGLVFLGIVVLLSRGWNLGLVLFVASIVVGLLFDYPLVAVGRDALIASVDQLTLQLVLTVVLIMVLGEVLRATSSLRGMVEALQELIPSGRLLLAGLPAFIGLLPMVGGAMFSAPMVDEVGDQIGLDQERKTFINYWFRHVWEYSFPLYPPVMLAAALLNVETLQLARLTWPLTAAAVVGGTAFGLLKMPNGRREEPSESARLASIVRLGESVWPVALVILLALALPVTESIRLIVSLVMTIALAMAVKRVAPRLLGQILYRHVPWNMVVVLLGALIFRRVLEQSGAVGAVSRILIASQVPVTMIAFAIPFIAGLLTGLTTGAYGIGFPVVLPLVASRGAIPPGWAVWLVAGGLLGAMSSPLHLCLSLTRVYFDARWGPVYRRIIASGLVVATVAALLLLV